MLKTFEVIECIKIIYFSYNQEKDYITVGTSVGFNIYTTNPLVLIHQENCGPIKIIEMINQTKLFVLVGDSEQGEFSPKKLLLWSKKSSNFEENIICSTNPFKKNIIGLKANKKYVLIQFLENLDIYATDNLKYLYKLDKNISLFTLSLNPENSTLLYSIEDSNEVCYFNLSTLSLAGSVEAHLTKVSLIALSYSDKYFATTSTKGTIINIFDRQNLTKLYSFKRGISEAKIFDINFSLNDNYFTLVSNSGSVHLFDMNANYEGFFFKLIGDCIAKSVTSISTKYFKRPTIVCFNNSSEEVEITCLSNEGYLAKYEYLKGGFKQKYSCNIFDLDLIS